jgi:hypothetical protein
MKLNALLKTLGFLALAATPVVAGTSPAPKQPAPVQPVNDDLGITIGAGYHTNYIWRGLNFGQHWVDGSLAGAIPLVEGTSLAWDVNYGSMFGNDHATPFPIKMDYQRIQLGAALQHEIGPVTASLGYRFYKNLGDLADASNLIGPGAAALGMQDGQEVSLGLATALGPINAAASANYDYVNHSWYFDLDLNTNIAVSDAISIVPYFNVGYGHNMNWQSNGNTATTGAIWAFNAQNNVSGWTAINTGLRFPVKLNSRATLTPYIGANLPLSGVSNLGGTARAAALPDTPYKSVLVGGVNLSVRF